jgi:hypothetical protein
MSDKTPFTACCATIHPIGVYGQLLLLFKRIIKIFNTGLDNFTKKRIAYVVGAFQLVFTPFILFYNMTLAKYIHISKFFVLIPLRFLDFKKRKWHYYMMEFCYYAGVLLNLFILQERLWGGILNHYFITVYAFASGPLIWAIYLNRDKLFLHSQSHLTTTYIHMTPAMMVWGLRWHNNGVDFKEFYPINMSLSGVWSSYVEMLNLTIPIYMVWAVGYYFYMFIFRWEINKRKDNMTMYRQFTENDKNQFGKVANKMKSRYTKGLLYILTHILSTLITTFIAMIMFNNYYLNTSFIIFTFLVTNWYGSYKLIKAIMFYEENQKKLKLVLEKKPDVFTVSDDSNIDNREDLLDENDQNRFIDATVDSETYYRIEEMMDKQTQNLKVE